MSVNKRTILIVDDSDLNRTILKDILEEEYNIIEAKDGNEAVLLLEQSTNISLVLLDIVMPNMDGFDVLTIMNIKNLIKQIPVIMITSEASSSAIERAYLLGVTDFINRPFDNYVVYHRVKNALVLNGKQKALTNIVVSQIKEKVHSTNLMVNILSQIVEFRNGESGLHVLHVNTLTNMLLKHMVKTNRLKMESSQIRDITLASSLHDIGKIGIPENILNKPGKLTSEEFELMKRHSEIGANMLLEMVDYENEPLLKAAYEICRWHHERWDGKGYPDGLKADKIPISAQVVSLADVYDALTSERVYKKAFSHKKAVEMIINGECGVFNPLLIEVFKEIHEEIEKETNINSNKHKKEELNEMIKETIHGELPNVDNETMGLIDYERIKYDFYASVNKEVQFEITFDPYTLFVYNYSDIDLGLKEIITNPRKDKSLIKLLGENKIDYIEDLAYNTDQDNPIFECDLKINVENELRWYHLYGYSIWNEEEGDTLTLKSIIGKLVDIHDNVKKFTKLEKKATHDSLTGLTNHDFAKKLINEKKSSANNKYLLFIIDVDNFKDVNDNFGHLYGDKVLKALSKSIKKATRSNDITARIGGDEFMIFLEHKTKSSESIAERISNSLKEEMAVYDVTVSIGVSIVDNNNFKYDDLFKFTDNILYKMKDSGKNGFLLKEYEG